MNVSRYDIKQIIAGLEVAIGAGRITSTITTSPKVRDRAQRQVAQWEYHVKALTRVLATWKKNKHYEL